MAKVSNIAQAGCGQKFKEYQIWLKGLLVDSHYSLKLLATSELVNS